MKAHKPTALAPLTIALVRVIVVSASLPIAVNCERQNQQQEAIRYLKLPLGIMLPPDEL